MCRFSKVIIIIVIGLFSVTEAFSQIPIWTVGTARTVEKGNLEASVFYPSRYGLSQTFEVSLHPIGIFGFPHIIGKKKWIEREKWVLSSKHMIYSPTVVLGVLESTGAFDLVEEGKAGPLQVGLSNEILYSRWLKPRTMCEGADYLLTLRLGAMNAFKFGDDSTTTMHKWYMYHRGQQFHDKTVFFVGADLDAHFNEKINYSVDVDFYYAHKSDNYALEHKGLLYGKISEKITLAVGYKFSFGFYDIGNKMSIMPLVDLTWHLKKQKKREKGLFRKKMF